MLKVPIFDTKMIGMTTKTARNTFLDRVVTKFSSRRYTFKDCATKLDKDLPIAFKARVRRTKTKHFFLTYSMD